MLYFAHNDPLHNKNKLEYTQRYHDTKKQSVNSLTVSALVVELYTNEHIVNLMFWRIYRILVYGLAEQ